MLILHGDKDAVTDPKSSQELYQRSRSPDKTLRTYDAWHSLTVGEPQETVDAVYRDIIGWLDQRASTEVVDLTAVSPSKLFPPFPTIKKVPPRRMQGAGGIGVGRDIGGPVHKTAEGRQGPLGMRNEGGRQPTQQVLQPLQQQQQQPQQQSHPQQQQQHHLHHQIQQQHQQQHSQSQNQRPLLQQQQHQQQGEMQQHSHSSRVADKGVRKSPSGSRETEPLLP